MLLLYNIIQETATRRAEMEQKHSSRGQTSVVPRTKAKVPGTLGPVLGTTKMGYFLEM